MSPIAGEPALTADCFEPAAPPPPKLSSHATGTSDAHVPLNTSITGAFQAVASAKDPADLRTLASKAFKPDFETTQAYARTVYEQVSATQSELASLVETQVTEFNKQMVVALDGLLKSAPAGSEAFVSAFKSAITTANQAYESSLHAFKDVGSTINATVASVQPVSTKRKAA